MTYSAQQALTKFAKSNSCNSIGAGNCLNPFVPVGNWFEINGLNVVQQLTFSAASLSENESALVNCVLVGVNVTDVRFVYAGSAPTGSAGFRLAAWTNTLLFLPADRPLPRFIETAASAYIQFQFGRLV